jgi:hypothetical protein
MATVRIRAPNSLRSRVEAAVLALGECRAAAVVARIGRTIPAAQAATAGRKKRRYTAKQHQGRTRPKQRKHDLVALGKSCLVVQTLVRLYKDGRIRRVKVGVYAPPLPRLYETA